MKINLIETLDKRADSIYRFDIDYNFHPLSKNSLTNAEDWDNKINCFCFTGRNSDELKKRAHWALDHSTFLYDGGDTISGYDLEYKLGMEENALEELNLLNYHFKKYGAKGRGLDTLSILFGGTVALAEKSMEGLVSFGGFQIINESVRQYLRFHQKTKINKVKDALKKFESINSLIENAKIESYTSEEAWEFVAKYKNLPEHVGVNEYNITAELREIYQKNPAFDKK